LGLREKQIIADVRKRVVQGGVSVSRIRGMTESLG